MNLGITIGTWTVGTGTCIGTTRQTGTACTSSCRYYTAVGICRMVIGTSIGTRTILYEQYLLYVILMSIYFKTM